MLVTPPVNTTGEFSCLTPYELIPGMVYKCHAIRTISELLTHGIDVYAEFYKPKNVEYAKYQDDHNKRASIVTLLSADNKYVFVPNTYIKSYPGMSGIPYSRKVVFIELGLVPDSIDLDYIIPVLTDAVTKAVGVKVEPKLGIVPYTGAVTHEQHIQLERTRRVNIQQHKTAEEELRELRARCDDQANTITQLTNVIAAYQTQAKK